MQKLSFLDYPLTLTRAEIRQLAFNSAGMELIPEMIDPQMRTCLQCTLYVPQENVSFCPEGCFRLGHTDETLRWAQANPHHPDAIQPLPRALLISGRDRANFCFTCEQQLEGNRCPRNREYHHERESFHLAEPQIILCAHCFTPYAHGQCSTGRDTCYDPSIPRPPPSIEDDTRHFTGRMMSESAANRYIWDHRDVVIDQRRLPTYLSRLASRHYAHDEIRICRLLFE